MSRFAINAAKAAAAKAEKAAKAAAAKAAAAKATAAKAKTPPKKPFVVPKTPALPSPFAITGKADAGQEVLRLKAKEMEIADPKKRTQPSGTDPVFDLSRDSYEQTEKMFAQTDPAIAQASLPRALAGSTYPLGDRMRPVIDLTPRIAERLAEKAQQGRGTAQEYFYHTAPIITGLEDIGVSRQDALDFLQRRLAPAFAGTSPRTNTEQNMRNATMMMYLKKQGYPISGDIYDMYGNARGYNMMTNHQNLTGKMFEGTHDPMTNPKPSSFLPNTAGDLGYVTADTHNIRGALLAMNEVEPGSIPKGFFKKPDEYRRYAETGEFNPATAVNDSLQSAKVGGREIQVEYGPMADVTFEAARLGGIAPAPMQSLGWFGSGADTGLASATKTIPELLNERVNVTAQALGMTPEEVLKLVYSGDLMVMQRGGFAVKKDNAGE